MAKEDETVSNKCFNGTSERHAPSHGCTPQQRVGVLEGKQLHPASCSVILCSLDRARAVMEMSRGLGTGFAVCFKSSKSSDEIPH